MKKYSIVLVILLLLCLIGATSRTVIAGDLFEIVQRGNPEEVQDAIDAGADVNIQNEAGITVLMYAVLFNVDSEIVEILINAGADVNARDERGGTALMYAVVNKDPEVTEMVEVLLDNGADLSLENDAGKTAFDYARDNENLIDTNIYWRLMDSNGEDVIVEFEDENLEAAVREKINKPEGAIYLSDVIDIDIEELDADNNRGIESTEGKAIEGSFISDEIASAKKYMEDENYEKAIEKYKSLLEAWGEEEVYPKTKKVVEEDLAEAKRMYSISDIGFFERIRISSATRNVAKEVLPPTPKDFNLRFFDIETKEKNENHYLVQFNVKMSSKGIIYEDLDFLVIFKMDEDIRWMGDRAIVEGTYESLAQRKLSEAPSSELQDRWEEIEEKIGEEFKTSRLDFYKRLNNWPE